MDTSKLKELLNKSLHELKVFGASLIVVGLVLGYYVGGKTLSLTIFFSSFFVILFIINKQIFFVQIRQKIYSLLLLFISLNFLFSSIYYFLYLDKPSNYNIAAGIQEGKYLNEYNSTLTEFFSLNKKLYLCGLLFENPKLVLDAISETEGSWSKKSKTFLLNEKTTFSLDHYVIVGEVPITGYTLEFVVKNEGSIKIFDSETSQLSHDLISSTISKAKTKEEMYDQIKILISKIVDKRNDVERQLIDYSFLNNKMGYIDFLYFSTITITTTGYGDIIPNSKVVRLIVIFQTLLGVFFIGYAFTIITAKRD